jgi:transcriptional regulator with XRE-family HTH domain
VAEETLGARIRRLRGARGMTLDQLALACSPYGRQVSRGMVQHWETGQHAPSLANFAALARVFGLSMDALLYGEDEAARIAAERDRAGDGPAAGGG